jgi:hypothetical protein
MYVEAHSLGVMCGLAVIGSRDFVIDAILHGSLKDTYALRVYKVYSTRVIEA